MRFRILLYSSIAYFLQQYKRKYGKYRQKPREKIGIVHILVKKIAISQRNRPKHDVYPRVLTPLDKSVPVWYNMALV